MSYTLQIWESPFPTNVQEADAICDQLLEEEESGKKGPQNPKFIALAKQLTHRYPCITQLTGNEPVGYEEGVWSEGPLNGITQAPIYGIGIVTSFLEEVVPFVQKTANALGLIVYDPQTADTYLPSGVVLIVELPLMTLAQKVAEIDPDAIEDDAHFQRIAIDCLKPMLASHGFKAGRKKNKFYRQHDGFNFEIGLKVHLSELAIWSILHITERLDLAEHMILFYERDEKKTITIFIVLEKLREITGTGAPPVPKFLYIRNIKKVSDIRSLMSQIMKYFEEAYFPVVNRVANLEDINVHIQSPDENNPFGVSGVSRIIQLLMSHLVKSGSMDALVKDIKSDITAQFPDCLVSFEKTLVLIKQDQLKNG